MYKSGDIIYYYTMYTDLDIGYAKLEIIKDSVSEVSTPVKILEKLGSIGGDYKIGSTISANQLQGVGVSGLKYYALYSEREVLRSFFEDYHKYGSQ